MNALFSGILPGGEQRSIRAKRAVVYLSGCSLSATILGTGLGFWGSRGAYWQSPYVLISIAALSLLFADQHFGFIRVPFPEVRRTVPSRWGHTGSRGILLWGLTNGLGFLTHVWFLGYYVVLLLVLLVGDPIFGAAVGLVYGISRSLPLLVMCFPRSTAAMSYNDAVDSVMSWRTPAHILNGAVLALLGLAVLGTMLASSP